MTPLQHAAVSLALGGPGAVVAGVAPDVANIPLLLSREWLPEADWRVQLSRIAHSPLTVALLLTLSPRRTWPYAVHWACDVVTHPSKQWSWPFR